MVRNVGFTLGVALMMIGATGCMSKNEDMRPQRSAELDRLNMMVGNWETTAETKIMGEDEAVKGSGKSISAWECDGWCLVERGQYDMGGDMGKMNGVAIWTWDPKAKKYRTFWADSMGSTAVGTGRYNEATKTWHMKGKGHGPMGTTHARGTAKMIDDKTVEWCYKEGFGPFGMIKFMEMNGTSKKK